ncbi:hypothetical protein HY572_05480, partial [Candidatus Micrarchaeota archaeon]|nr:hypothetical protein [Candidatus Micrarchaeota archaeon]
MSSRFVNPVFLAVFALMFVSLVAAANPPILVPLQGKLLNSTGSVISGSRSLNFSLFNASVGSTPVWTENRIGANNYTVVNGLFDVLLGDNASLANVNFSESLWLEINVSNEVLTPRMRLGAAPFARTSERVFGVQSALNESLVTLNKTSAATGGGAVLNIVENAGTGAEISTPSFTLRNGILVGVAYNGTTNFTGPTLTRAFIGNGSSLTALDAGNLVNGTVPDGRLTGTYSG